MRMRLAAPFRLVQNGDRRFAAYIWSETCKRQITPCSRDEKIWLDERKQRSFWYFFCRADRKSTPCLSRRERKMMYFSCLCKKRYQKKQTSVPLDRVGLSSKDKYVPFCSPTKTGLSKNASVFRTIPTSAHGASVF